MTNESLRPEQIDTILTSNWNRFENWVVQTSAYQAFDFPQDVAEVLIPRRILELSQDPTAVHALVSEGGKNMGIVVYERTSLPLSNLESVKQWHKERSSPRLLPNSQEEAPEGIDYMHLRFLYELEKGTLTVNDKVYFQYLVDIPNGYPYVAETRNYTDRKELQRQGIGTSFYNRYEDVLKRLGFKYLTGSIISPHPKFFRKNRTQYDDLPDNIKEELPSFYAHVVQGDTHNRYMVRIL